MAMVMSWFGDSRVAELREAASDEELIRFVGIATRDSSGSQPSCAAIRQRLRTLSKPRSSACGAAAERFAINNG